MLRLMAISLLFSPAAIMQFVASASGDRAPISIDDIEESKSARLMKNKEDIDVQSTYHEDDIQDTGNILDEFAARLVKNRGPITAKIMASGSHTRYCKGEDDENCSSVNFSLVAWKFAGDKGEVHGTISEKFANDNGKEMKVDVDCMVRNKENNEAIVGGVVKESSNSGSGDKRRAYVKLLDAGPDGVGDYVSNMFFDDGGINSHCSTPSMADNFDLTLENNMVNPVVSVCSKHGDWDACLEKMKAEQAVQ